jgi:uncharacterized protein (TIGR03435 family)
MRPIQRSFGSRNRWNLFIATLALLLAVGAVGQNQPLKPGFEVASIEATPPGTDVIALMGQPGGRFVATNVTLAMLIGYAYRLRDFQIEGFQGWMTTDRWDIEAKAAEGSIPPGPLPNPNSIPPQALMLQSLLEGRFQLKTHRDTREMSVYELRPAKGGTKIKLAEDQSPVQRFSPRGNLRMARGEMEGTAVPFGFLITALSQQVGRTIIDRTGLKGLYDIKLVWTPELPPPAPGRAFGVGDEGLRQTDTSGPSIFTALTEQLGLQLESAKGPTEFLVIDHAEKPSEN